MVRKPMIIPPDMDVNQRTLIVLYTFNTVNAIVTSNTHEIKTAKT